MNERIKDIWNKVDRQEEGTRRSIVITTESELEKFAELMIKDAIDGLLNAYGPDDCLPQEEIAGFLKKHFGVER